MTARSICIVILFAISTAAGTFLRAGEPSGKIDYLTQIKPLLATKCYACHGALNQEADLRLETRALMIRGGDSGQALMPGEANASLILERITAEEDSRMPPPEDGAPLTSEEIQFLRDWINQGAVAPDEAVPQTPNLHWAFRRIERPMVEELHPGENPIDHLLQAKRGSRGLKVQARSERSLLIRRLYLDLIGLPPSLEQLRDDRPWDEIVDDLLANPHHGERWGRHWMDIWRYSDWYGLGAQLRNSQKHIWHWRDWIVDSLNSDKGYDRMIQEMIAGDELAPRDANSIAGTGFLARNYYLFNRTTWLDDTIEHTCKAFLGLTLNCAKCHDHKYDPISQVDYYNLRAIFEPHQVRLDPVPGVTDLDEDGLPRVFDDHLDAPTWLHVRGDPKNPDKKTAIKPRVPAIFASFQPEIEPVALPPFAYVPGSRDYVQSDQVEAAQARVMVAEEALAAARKKLAEVPRGKPETGKGGTTEHFFFEDNFERARPGDWEIVGNDWEYKDGALHRTTATRDPEYVRLNRQLPPDFEVTCRYTTTGGTTYKSITFRFDESDDRKYANFVYTSAHEPGPKTQVAYTRGGASSYPSEGRATRPIRVGETYELRFAVRDQLVNVWLDGEFVVAYLLPDRQVEGRFTLSGFDATVAFDWIQIRSLPRDVELTDAKNAVVPSPQDAETGVRIAELGLQAAESKLESLRAIIAADAARYGASSANVGQLAKEAWRLDAEALLAEAEHELLAAGADDKKRKAAEGKAAKARQKLEAADKDSGAYSAIRASRKALEGPDHKQTDYPATYSPTSTGRRLALARWMTSRDNPLTARVAVNHVWLRHFGEPLVESVFDFGLRAEKPLHADVLDFLAAELMESGWSFRRLHRLIVTSQAYQLSSSEAGADPHTVAADPDNSFYWRMNSRRMEAQIVRDSLLQLAGTLDRTMGGPPLDVGNKSKRRSLYYKHSRDHRDKFLSMFDDADLLRCYRRSESIVPQQALAMVNSELSLSAAAAIAAKILENLAEEDETALLDVAFEALIGRTATQQERAECLSYCESLRQLLRENESIAADEISLRIRTLLVHSLLNHNDFITIR